MKIFDEFSPDGKPCIICKTNKQGKAVLIPIQGTSDGNVCEAAQVHLDCIDLTYWKEKDLIYQALKD